MGKHGNLITRERGSWFFIGIMLLDVALEYDQREKDFCGTCTRCISGCPTGAIVAPYVVDARLCISYLTIELRGPIPREMRAAIGNRIFGCDDCQDVCPWNRFAVKTPERGLRPRQEDIMPDLAPLVVIGDKEFDAKFGSSAVRRCRRDGFVRNVAVALGNSRDPRTVPALARAIADASPLVRSHAAWALGRIDDPEALRILKSARRLETDGDVLAEIELARISHQDS
jgi:epoxyqueuosine reductase